MSRSRNLQAMLFFAPVVLLAGSFDAGPRFVDRGEDLVKFGAMVVALPRSQEQEVGAMRLPGGNSVEFSPVPTRQDVPGGWSTWHGSDAPKLLESPHGETVSLVFAKPVSAFGIELMPVWKKGRTMRLEIVDPAGKSQIRFVDIQSGARFFGFVGGKVRVVRLSKEPFDKGSFAMGNMVVKTADESPEVVAAKHAIDAQWEIYKRAFRNQDAALLEPLFDDSGVQMLPGGVVIQGKPLQIEDLKRFMEAPADLTTTRTDFWIVGDLAYEYGNYNFHPRNRPTGNEAGYCMIWKKMKDGVWRIHAGFDIYPGVKP